MILIEYPKCTTCKKAALYLNNLNITYSKRNIITDNPTITELDTWIKKYNIDIKNFFNTSGLKYKELKLKEVLPTLNYEEKLKILSSDGMLVKRPIFISDDYILIGFKPKEWEVIND